VGGHGLELVKPDGTTFLAHGDGVVATSGVSAWDGSFGLLLDGNEIQGALRAGVMLDGSSADLSGNTFAGNAMDLVWQRCDGVEEPGGLPEVPIVEQCPQFNLSMAPLEFYLYLEESEPL
jgi:hypothetical protein